MDHCRVQEARQRKGLPDFPCKPVGTVEFETFAKSVDPRIVTECLRCPPDALKGQSCAWEFMLGAYTIRGHLTKLPTLTPPWGQGAEGKIVLAGGSACSTLPDLATPYMPVVSMGAASRNWRKRAGAPGGPRSSASALIAVPKAASPRACVSP